MNLDGSLTTKTRTAYFLNTMDNYLYIVAKKQAYVLWVTPKSLLQNHSNDEKLIAPDFYKFAVFTNDYESFDELTIELSNKYGVSSVNRQWQPMHYNPLEKKPYA